MEDAAEFKIANWIGPFEAVRTYERNSSRMRKFEFIQLCLREKQS